MPPSGSAFGSAFGGDVIQDVAEGEVGRLRSHCLKLSEAATAQSQVAFGAAAKYLIIHAVATCLAAFARARATRSV